MASVDRLVGEAKSTVAKATTMPWWGWVAIALIIAGLVSVFSGVMKAVSAGSQANAAAAVADTIMDKYGQRDQTAALRSCLRLALKGKDCEGESKDTDGSKAKKGGRAEACGYREDRCMTSSELADFGKCMRGDEL